MKKLLTVFIVVLGGCAAVPAIMALTEASGDDQVIAHKIGTTVAKCKSEFATMQSAANRAGFHSP